MYRIEMLPAEYGDCLWIEYGTGRKNHRILIDGGTPASFPALETRIKSLPGPDRRFELLVVTHIDSDHIGGVLKLLERRKELRVTFGDIWFNGWRHLQGENSDELGPVDGERLSTSILQQRLRWNGAFRGRAIVVSPEKLPPKRTLPGGMKITLLSPTTGCLARLAPVWERVVRAAGLSPGKSALRTRARPGGSYDFLGSTLDVESLCASRFHGDRAKANGTSIAFVAEFEKKSCLFGADAFAPALSESLLKLRAGLRTRLDAMKVPHHGSRANLSDDLLERVDCGRFLVSTNGERFEHPDPESIARIVRRFRGAKLHFNYRTQFSRVWEGDETRRKYGYCVYGPRRGSTVVHL